MPRIHPVNRDQADNKTAQLLSGVEKKMGKVPNLIGSMAQSTATANAYLGFSSALSGGSLSAQDREQIALAVGQANDCDYCLAAHSMLGRGAGLSDDAILEARRGQSSDQRSDAILKFAVKVVESRGFVSDADVASLREQGLTDGEVTEVIANIALNLFTNYFNHIAETEVDFPQAAALPS